MINDCVNNITKRTILSAAHKIFDPIGFTAPVTIIPRLLLKRLWNIGSDWDTTDEKTRKEFLNWHKQLYCLNSIKIPRKFGSGVLSLHTFCDASRVAYATVTFLRVENENRVELHLLAAKTRIAPDNATIPRLELLAACIGSRQTEDILQALNYKNIPVFCWSDSTTTLTWINRDSQWGIFVWNRVREIRRLSESWTWKYVPGSLNPADLPSRGCQAKQLIDSRWWEGPDWLRGRQKNWPSLTDEVNENEVNSELKKSAKISMLSVKHIDINLVNKFSSYNKLIRFFCIMLRFKKFLKKETIESKYLTCKEIHETEVKFLKCLQEEWFSLKNDPKLSGIKVFKHTDGLLRLKTRIIQRNDNFSFLCPIILDSKHEVVELLIRETHENMCHAGVQSVMCQLREKHWILRMRKTVREVILKYVICKRQCAKPMKVEPAPLPLNRVKDAAVFEVTGIDFAGPLILRGQEKAWICLFICAIYRAVYLELVTSMSTATFLDALENFICQRGRPAVIYSDNGTNFVGANSAFEKLNWNVIAKTSSAKRIQWIFNPPSAAWWGGWWERLIGMVKVILRKVLRKSCLTYEQMYTVLVDCERTINARPLTYVSDSPDDLKPLTPAMFLNDSRESECPDIDILRKVNFNSVMRRKQEMMEHLRDRFGREYLSQMIFKNNAKESRAIKVGDIVMIGDDNRKRINWPKIEKLIEGRDGVVRVAVLKTKDGILKRPLQRIYPLEICSNDVNGSDMREKVINQPILEEINQEKCETKTDYNTKDIIKTQSGRIVKKPDYYG